MAFGASVHLGRCFCVDAGVCRCRSNVGILRSIARHILLGLSSTLAVLCLRESSILKNVKPSRILLAQVVECVARHFGTDSGQRSVAQYSLFSHVRDG